MWHHSQTSVSASVHLQILTRLPPSPCRPSDPQKCLFHLCRVNLHSYIFCCSYFLLSNFCPHRVFPRWRNGKESTCQYHKRCKRHRFNPCIRKIPCRWKWQPTPVFLPGKSHGQRSLAGYSLWVHRFGCE